MARDVWSRGAAAAAAIGFVLSGCGGPPGSDQPVTSSSGIHSSEASAAAASAATSADTEAPGGRLMMVVADELRMRAAPGTASDTVAGLRRGDVVQIMSAPADADGFTWYEATDIGGRSGWVASGDGADAWLAALPSNAAGVPLLSFEFACDVTGPFQGPSTLIFPDGRVIHRSSGLGEWLVRTLSASGLAHVRDNVLGSPHLQASGDYVPVPRPGAEPPGHGACQYTFIIATAVPIEVTSVGWFGDQEESEFYEPSPERKVLDAIAHNLMSIDAVLDESSWESDGWLPWIPAEHLIGLGPGEGPPPGGAVVEPESTGLGDLATFGAPSGRGRCDLIPRVMAFQFARALNEAAHEPSIRLNTSANLAFRTDTGWTYGLLHPNVPGTPTCEELDF